MFGLGVWELSLILVIVLVIFGAGKLPEIGSGMGKAISNFKKGVSSAEKKNDKLIKDEKEELERSQS